MDGKIWPRAEHTRAKHTILEKYIEAWAPILSQTGFNGRLAYIDGFAGPGKYIGGEDGSPVVVLKALKNHSAKDRFKSEFVNIFIEKDKERSEILKSTIKERCCPLPEWVKYEVNNGEFNKVLSGIISDLEDKGKELAPCLCFVDPFGWSDLNYKVLANFMKYKKAELLITFMAGYLNRFIWDDSHMSSIKKLFTENQIREIKESTETETAILRYFLENLQEEMKKVGVDSVFHLAFSASNIQNNLEYYLVYLSKNCKGFQVMKSAMFSVASDGTYKFSDFDFKPDQTTLIDYGGQNEWVKHAAYEFYQHLVSSGIKEITIKEAKDYITCKTVWPVKKSIFEDLEESGKITVKVDHRKGKTFPDRGSFLVNHFQ